MGKVIFLDTHYSDILARLSSMKVDRIVGHGNDMADNLQYRQQFYEGILVLFVYFVYKYYKTGFLL